MDRHSPEAIFQRFRRVLLTHEYEIADEMHTEILPEIREGFEDILNDYEMYLFSILLKQIREIRVLKKKLPENKTHR